MKAAELRISRGLQGVAGAVDAVLEQIAGERVGFFLFVVPFSEDESDDQRAANYVANISRADLVALIRSQLKYFDENPTDTPLHTIEAVKEP